MKPVIASIIALLAATAGSAPIATEERRQLPGVGSLTSPVTGVLSKVGEQAPPALSKVTETLNKAGKQDSPTKPQAVPSTTIVPTTVPKISLVPKLSASPTSTAIPLTSALPKGDASDKGGLGGLGGLEGLLGGLTGGL
ncbi:hypothetical protein F5B20DRAFT_575072 [Whalleya microplaca]|nr:hypothetical protein F5B20DRAFT_575072 [Whalleya microplaca]